MTDLTERPQPRVGQAPVGLHGLLTSGAASWLGLMAGVLLPFAFAPFGWAWLAVLSLALLFAVVAVAPRKQALRAGYLFGLGYFGVGVSWVYVSMAEFGAGGILISGLLTALFIAFLALFPLLLVQLARRLQPRSDALLLLLALPALWVALEWVRSWLFTGFPWLLLGYTQTDTWLAPVASVFGVYGLSWLVALLAGAVAWAVLSPQPARLAGAAALVAGMLALGPVLDRPWTRTAGDPIKVALIQGNIPQDLKWDPTFARTTLDRYWDLTVQSWEADLVVWPESALPAFYHQLEDNYLADLKDLAQQHDTDLLLGLPVLDLESERVFNSMVLVTGEGGMYHKRHLVPFGEYLPLRSVFGSALDILGAPMADFSPGGEPEVLNAADHPFAVTICYEAVYGRLVATLLPQAQVLVNVSNDAWFGDSLAPHQHLQMARMRAMETGRDMVRATNTGVTAFIDYRGQVTARAPQFEATTLMATVTPRQGATPYVRWTDWPVLSAVGLVLIALAANGFLRRR